MRRASEGSIMGGHTRDVQPQPGDRMEGQRGTRGAKEIVQGPGKVLECNRSMSEKTA
jgi:hypothetical protein